MSSYYTEEQASLATSIYRSAHLTAIGLCLASAVQGLLRCCCVKPDGCAAGYLFAFTSLTPLLLGGALAAPIIFDTAACWDDSPFRKVPPILGASDLSASFMECTTDAEINVAYALCATIGAAATAAFLLLARDLAELSRIGGSGSRLAPLYYALPAASVVVGVSLAAALIAPLDWDEVKRVGAGTYFGASLALVAAFAVSACSFRDAAEARLPACLTWTQVVLGLAHGGFYFFGVCGDLFEEEEDSFARDVCSTGVVMAEYVLLLNQLSWVSDLVVALALLKHNESRRKLAAAVADGFFLETA